MKFIKITTGIRYLHHLWCMTWIQHVLHERRMKEKTVSMLCNHSAQKWSGCASVFFCRDFCKNYILQAKYAHMHCTLCVFPLWILFSLLKYLKICFRPRAEYCWLSQRFPPSLLSMYLKKKHSKCQTGNSGFMKTEKNLAVRFTQRWTGELMCTGFSKHPFITCFKSTGHQFIHVTSIFASPFPHTCAAGSPVSVYKQSGSRYRTPQLFWPPLPMQRVQSACWSQQTKVSGLHSFSSLAFCPRVQVV